MNPTPFSFTDCLTPASLARLAARYPAIVAGAARRDLPPALSHWDAPFDPETERLMREKPLPAERRVA